MTLAPGTRLGSYEIVRALGAGGMGEVYRAHDTKLGRDVAIKVLPAAFAADADRMVRFQREAHVLASLNHPHLATIHGREESDSIRALVMELVEGPTLAERIGQGAIPLEEALPIARQIAEALEYAHEHSVIHRDLKPANVKVTAEGAVKVLDFGLAKALSDDHPTSEVSDSPTLSAVATRAGVILGTAAYMSPEQAKGKAVDRRTDIWSFGVVLHEMLTGRRLYTGETPPETLARVIEREADLEALPVKTPWRVRELLRRCLTKDPRGRLQAIGEARVALEDAIAHPEATAPGGAEVLPVPPADSPLRRLGGAWVAIALAVGLGLALWAPWHGPTPDGPLVRVSVELGADASLSAPSRSALALSEDGGLLAFVARGPSGPTQLYLRRLEELQASPLAETEDAADPFFSPDGRWIGFFAGGKLKKVSVTGGVAVTLADAREPRGGTWSADGTIVFTPDSRAGLLRVSSAGGTPEALTKPDPTTGELTHRWPQALPGGETLLYTSHDRLATYEDASIVAHSLRDGTRKVVHRGGFYGRYLPSGHLAYIHEGTLFAAPFDLDRFEVRGQSVAAVEGVANSSGSAGAQFAFSSNGTLVYVPGGTFAVEAPIDWMDREGKKQHLRAVTADYRSLRFSPDGVRLALEVSDGKKSEIWVYEWARDTLSRLTFDTTDDGDPVWTPDGRRNVFASRRVDKTAPALYWQRADGTGEPERLTEVDSAQAPTSWHPSGRVLAFVVRHQQTNWDVMILDLEGDETSGLKARKPRAFVSSPFDEMQAAFCPDGRWLAYSSNESGGYEVYVRPFPGPGGTWQVSTGGGQHPTWSSKRPELLYRTMDPQIMVARYTVEGSSFRADKPQLWSPGRFAFRPTWRNFDLHPDGHRVAVLGGLPEQAERQDRVVLIFNFSEALRRLAPPAKP